MSRVLGSEAGSICRFGSVIEHRRRCVRLRADNSFATAVRGQTQPISVSIDSIPLDSRRPRARPVSNGRCIGPLHSTGHGVLPSFAAFAKKPSYLLLRPPLGRPVFAYLLRLALCPPERARI